MTWVDHRRRAGNGHGFRLLAQPIVDARTGAVSSYELLLRMIGEDGDLIPPAAFLYIAERFDLIQELDRWVSARPATSSVPPAPPAMSCS